MMGFKTWMRACVLKYRRVLLKTVGKNMKPESKKQIDEGISTLLKWIG